MRGSRVVVSLITVVTLSGCATHGPARPQPLADDGAGAVAANFWYAPGRGIICGTSAFLSGSYGAASELMHGGCSGPWTVSDQDIRNTVP
jgi:hypothetical protein